MGPSVRCFDWQMTVPSATCTSTARAAAAAAAAATCSRRLYDFHVLLADGLLMTDVGLLQTFVSLVDKVGLNDAKEMPVEFLVDRELTFRVYSRLKPFHVSTHCSHCMPP